MAGDPTGPGRELASLAAGLRGRLELSRDRPRRYRQQGAFGLGTGADRLYRLSQRRDRLFRGDHVLPTAPMDGLSAW